MSKITIQLSGIAAELVLGNYMPTDATIFNNWEDFYHYNDLIHESQLLAAHIQEVILKVNDETVYTGLIPASQFREEKSICPAMVERALYLRAECAEEAVFECNFEVEQFDKNKLFFRTQDYHALFRVGQAFVTTIEYDGQIIKPEWISGKPVGNICLLCRYEQGYLVPLYDAIKKLEAQPKAN